jgi:hypothetical protein
VVYNLPSERFIVTAPPLSTASEEIVEEEEKENEEVTEETKVASGSSQPHPRGFLFFFSLMLSSLSEIFHSDFFSPFLDE